MNRIDGLIARMRDIPGKERRATQLQDMRVSVKSSPRLPILPRPSASSAMHCAK